MNEQPSVMTRGESRSLARRALVAVLLSSTLFVALIATGATAAFARLNTEHRDRAHLDTATGDRRSADLVIRQLDETTYRDELLRYRFVVRNQGPSDARDVVITDPLVSSARLVSGDLLDVDGRASTLGSCANVGDLVCRVPKLPAHGEVMVAVVLAGDRQMAERASHCVSVQSRTRDRDRSNNSTSIAPPRTTVADLAIDQTLDPEAVRGEPFHYRMKITNRGPDRAEQVTITNPLAEGLVFDRVAVVERPGGAPRLECVFVDATKTVSCVVSSLEPGAAAEVAVTVIVSRDHPGDQVGNCAAVDAGTDDPDRSNNVVVSSSPIGDAPDPTADVSVVVSPSSTVSVAGTATGIDVRVRNAGPGTALDAVALINVPAEMTVSGVTVSSSDVPVDSITCVRTASAVTCRAPRLRRGQSYGLSIDGTLRSSARPGVEPFDAVVSAQSLDPRVDDNRAASALTVVRRATMVLSTSLAPPVVAAGGSVTLSLTMTNNGPSDAEVAFFEARVPTMTDVAAFTAPAGASCVVSAGLFQCNLGTTVAGRVVTVTATLIVSRDHPPGVLASEIELFWDGIDPVPQSVTATAVATVVPRVTPGAEPG